MSKEALLTRSEALSRSLACPGKAYINVNFGRLSNAGLANGKRRIWSLRKSSVDWLAAPTRRRIQGKLQGVLEWDKYHRRLWRAQATHAMLSDMPCSPGHSSSGDNFDIPGLVLKVCKILHVELILKPVLHFIRCLDLRESDGLLLRRPSLCNLGRMRVFSRLVGRVMLAVAFFVSIVLQPFVQLAAPALAAAPVDVDVTSRESQDFYDILFKKFQEKDEELGRVPKQDSMQEKLRELHAKVKEQKERSEAAKHDLEQLLQSKATYSSISPHEERVLAILDRTFKDYKEKLQDKLSYVSPYEEDLRTFFNAKFATLQAFQKETEKVAVLRQKAREFIDEIRAEERRLQGKALRDREEACQQLKAEEVQLRNALGRLITKHHTFQEQLQVSDGGNGVSEDHLQGLDSEIGDVWERMLNVKAKLWQNEIGSLQEALVKLPILEKQLEEGLLSSLKDQSSSSSAVESQHKEAQQKVVNDLTKVLNNVFEHKFLPEAIDIEPSKAVMDEQLLAFLDALRLEEKSSKKLLETINKVIHEDIEAEKISAASHTRQGTVVAPGLQRMKEERRAELKQFLKENPEIGREYMAQKQERVLTYRDRVLAQAWYNEKSKQWEMSPEGLKYAVDKELVESARVRHDRRVMYFKLKGDRRTFFADLQAFDATYVNYGGFDALHLKMLGSGVPVPVVFMWIPFGQLDPMRVFSFPFKVMFREICKILKAAVVNPMTTVFFQFTVQTLEELFGRVVFPALEKLPKLVRIFIGLQLPDNAPPRTKPPLLMELKKLVQSRLEDRFGQGEGNTAWWLTLPLRWFIMWIPYVYVARLVGKALGQILGPGEDTNEVEWKQKKGKELMKKLKADNPKAIEDPVRQAFDKMKRVKDPELRLREFAGLDTVKEEINEIVTFLRDPAVFKEMGARPPRGVLIAGRPGTGKTSLAIAIAAEAKVPLVDLNGLELEGGAWVGQGASNVRELFKTARELAPLIILMDDFDYFAGVRGESGDTRKQDHESLINQLLVELDGFETQEGVVLVATSSRPESIDEALRRPGRMDRTITLPMPNKLERETILRRSAKESMDDDLIELVDWKEMARKTAGMTPQQLKEVPRGLESTFVSWKYTDDEELFNVFKWIVRLNKITPDWLAKSKWMYSWKSRLRDSLGLKVKKEDVEAAVACIDVFNESRPGIEYRNPGYIWTREFKFPHAVWAVGRGLVGALLPDFDVLENIWLDQGSWEGIGFTRFTKRREGGYEETSTLTRTYYEKKLVHCFGSSVAANLLLSFGESNDLSNREIEEAHKIATAMVLELGWGPDNSQSVYSSPTEITTLSMGDGLEVELEAKVEMIYSAAADKATEMIEKNRRVLDAMLEHVLEFDAISKQDIARLMKENGAIFESEPFVLIPFEDNKVEQGLSGQSTEILVTG